MEHSLILGIIAAFVSAIGIYEKQRTKRSKVREQIRIAWHIFDRTGDVSVLDRLVQLQAPAELFDVQFVKRRKPDQKEQPPPTVEPPHSDRN